MSNIDQGLVVALGRSIVNVAQFSALPTVGSDRKLYITEDNNNIYRWDGASYPLVSSVGGGLTVKGSWDALNNVPILASGVGASGDLYTVSVANSNIIPTIDGISSASVGDQMIFQSDSTWTLIPAVNAVVAPIFTSTNLTATTLDGTYIVTANIDVTITVPASNASNEGRFCRIVKEAGSASVIVVPEAPDTTFLGGDTSYEITGVAEGVTVFSAGVLNGYIKIQDSRSDRPIGMLEFLGDGNTAPLEDDNWKIDVVGTELTVYARELGVWEKKVTMDTDGLIDSTSVSTDYIDLNTSPAAIAHQAGRFHWNEDDSTAEIGTDLGNTVIQIGQESLVKVYNNSGIPINSGSVVYPIGTSTGGFSNIAKAQADSHVTITTAYGVATSDMPNGTYGFVNVFGKVRNLDTSLLSEGEVYLSADVLGGLTNTRPEFPNYEVLIGLVTKIDASDGEIIVDRHGIPEDTTVNFWNGVIRETFDFRVTSNGTIITGALSPSNGHPDLTLMFSDGFTVFTATPDATIALTAGTDAIPQSNYVYILKSTKTLTVSAASFPEVEHAKVATIVLRSAATTQADGALRNQNWNDAIENTTTFQGHLSHITDRLRQINSSWANGTEGTVLGTPNNVYVDVTSGQVYQLHKQTFPAISMSTGGDIHVVNDPVTPFRSTTNLNDITVDALGDSLNGKWFGLVIWGIANKTGEMSHIMCNLPRGDYGKEKDALNDKDSKNVYTIPSAFQGVGFLIGLFVFKLNGGQFEYNGSPDGYKDLRGFVPNNTAGSGVGGSGITTFLGLSDTPADYVGNTLKLSQVNGTETALEFTDEPTVNNIILEEITTPTVIPSFGRIYAKADNKLYFQDGSGVEHEVSLV
jgi:hypothetical protein